MKRIALVALMAATPAAGQVLIESGDCMDAFYLLDHVGEGEGPTRAEESDFFLMLGFLGGVGFALRETGQPIDDLIGRLRQTCRQDGPMTLEEAASRVFRD